MKYENDKMMNEIMRRGGKKSAERMRRKSRTVSVLIGICAVWMVLLSIQTAGILLKPNTGPEQGSPPNVGSGDDDQGILPGGTPPDVGGLPPEGIEPEQETQLFIDEPWKMEQAAASVVKLEVYDSKDEKIATGSGFCFFEDRILVTAAHVVANMDHMIAAKDAGDTFRIDRVIYGDTESDIAFCELPEDAGLTPLTMSAGYAPKGERVVAIGTQFGITNLVTTGDLAGNWETDDVLRLIFTAPVSPGNSGGPLLNSHGQVIGVVSGTYEKGQNLNIALSIVRVYDLYQQYVQ